MKILGLYPKDVFSGFETSFFKSLEDQGVEIHRLPIEDLLFKAMCTVTSFYPNKKIWGTRRDVAYHASVQAFKRKSRRAQQAVAEFQKDADVIYQIGSLWNPVGPSITIPLFLQVDYTSQLSKKRNSEWKRKPGREEQFWLEAEKRLYDNATRILTTTENARQSIIEDYGVESTKIITVGGGVSSPYDNPPSGKLPDYQSKKVLFVGKGFKGKGLDTLLEAFQLVREDIPDAQLTVVGPTNENICGPGINYLGRLSDKNQLRDLYYQHALFVMPSRFEPLGQVFLEAMSCQLPCIGTTLDAMPELIVHGKTGFTIEAGDHVELAGYIKKTLSNPELAATFGAAGFRRLQDHYIWSVVGKKIYDSLKGDHK